MIRRRLMLVAAPLCVVMVAASVAFASTSDTEQSGDAKLDKLHAGRPIAASPPFDGLLASAIGPSELQSLLEERAAREAVAAQLLADQVRAQAEAAAFAEELQAAGFAASLEAAGRAAWAARGPAADALACIRARESDGSGGYGAVSSSGTYRGAYQFLQGTWDSTAAAAGRDDLVGVDPAAASPADQDAMAAHLYSRSGSSSWGGTC